MSNKNQAITLLLATQQALNNLDIERADDSDSSLHPNDFRSRLLFADLGNGLDIEYYGEVWDEAWEIAIDAITQPEIASRLTSLRITGPDEGANGCRTHNIEQLLASEAHFPQLLNLYIRPTDVTDHNMVDIADDQIAALITRCPNLNELTLPNAPEAAFFDIPLQQLRYLRIGMAWRTHRFIANMATSRNMPKLSILDFCDSLSVFNQPPQTQHNPDFDDGITSFEDYQQLIKSNAIRPNMVLHLRNAYLTQTQFDALNAIKALQLSASLSAPHVYISHWKKPFSTPFEHLLLSQF